QRPNPFSCPIHMYIQQYILRMSLQRHPQFLVDQISLLKRAYWVVDRYWQPNLPFLHSQKRRQLGNSTQMDTATNMDTSAYTEALKYCPVFLFFLPALMLTSVVNRLT